MIKYPKGFKSNESINFSNTPKQSNNKINYAKRGMSLEERINSTNKYYLSRDKAVIHKKPTPIQVVQVDYPRRSAARITEAYYRQSSTTDFNGIYRGFYIDFEAKETKNKTSFPLANIPNHQLEHMKKCSAHGGICFLLISFTSHNKVYLLPYAKLEAFITNNEAKSIPYTYIQTEGIQCKVGLFPMIDYLEAVDQLIDNNLIQSSVGKE